MFALGATIFFFFSFFFSKEKIDVEFNPDIVHRQLIYTCEIFLFFVVGRIVNTATSKIKIGGRSFD